MAVSSFSSDSKHFRLRLRQGSDPVNMVYYTCSEHPLPLRSFQRPLADLPKTFGLNSGEKGFFPHYLNTRPNQTLVCPLSEITSVYFNRQGMTRIRAKQFDQWWAKNKDKTFHLKEDMEKYCRSDVGILLDWIVSLRRLFKDTTAIDPLTPTFTLASIGLEFWRTHILKEKTVEDSGHHTYWRI